MTWERSVIPGLNIQFQSQGGGGAASTEQKKEKKEAKIPFVIDHGGSENPRLKSNGKKKPHDHSQQKAGQMSLDDLFNE